MESYELSRRLQANINVTAIPLITSRHVDETRIGHELNGNAIRKLKVGDMIHVVYLAMVGANQGSFRGSRLVHQDDPDGPYLLVEPVYREVDKFFYKNKPSEGMQETGFISLPVIDSNGRRKTLKWSKLSHSKYYLYMKESS